MKKFEMPTMSIQRLEPEDIIRTSGCFEAYDCLECYCAAVTCEGDYSCTGFKCRVDDY